jgi:3-methyladenine DNA glycosylase Tag
MPDLNHLNDEFEKLQDFVMVDRGKNDPSLASRVTAVETIAANISANLAKSFWLLVGIFISLLGDGIVLVIHAAGVRL